MKETTAIIQLYTEKINWHKRPKKDVSGVNRVVDYQWQVGCSQTCTILKITALMSSFPC